MGNMALSFKAYDVKGRGFLIFCNILCNILCIDVIITLVHCYINNIYYVLT